RKVSTCGPETTREKSTLWATSPSESAAVTVTTVVPSGVPAEVVSVKIALQVGSHSGGLKAQDAPSGRLAHEYCTSSVDPDRIVSVTVALTAPPGATEADGGSMDIVKSNSGGGAGGAETLRVKFAVRERVPSDARMTTAYVPAAGCSEGGLRRRFARAVVDAVPVGRGQEDPLVRIPVRPPLDDRRQVEGHLAEGRRVERILARPRCRLARCGEAIPGRRALVPRFRDLVQVLLDARV